MIDFIMKRIHFFLSMRLLLGALTLTSCHDDDGLYFTLDEVIGDISTGKQTRLVDNTIKVYTTEESGVNVQGASGAITAVSSDERVATVRCLNDQPKRVVVKGVKGGSARIIVTDAEGHSAFFMVVADDVEKAWGTQTIIMTYDEVRCRVEGVNREDSLAIVKDARARFAELKYVIKRRAYVPSEAHRMYIYDKADKLLEMYAVVWNKSMQDDTVVFQFTLFSNDVETPVENLSVGPQFGLERSVGRFYQKQYPKLKKVTIRQSVKFVKI